MSLKCKYGQEWTHKGLMYGFVPIYVNQPYSECPEISARNWACELLLDLADAMFSFAAMFSDEPLFFFKVTGEL